MTAKLTNKPRGRVINGTVKPALNGVETSGRPRGRVFPEFGSRKLRVGPIRTILPADMSEAHGCSVFGSHHGRKEHTVE